MGNHHQHHNSTKNLKLAFFINLLFASFEVVGGFFTNSFSRFSLVLRKKSEQKKSDRGF